MFSKKSWYSGGVWKPKNPHSLEHLKYLYNVLGKNQTVNEQNLTLLVETLRSISEILIWGDQNDSSVFDFFLEKNMLLFFLRFMRQKSGRYICTQLLQTLNILFDNISNETSVYYLLSNNHINSIIVHKFDFSDEEVMAYYISFLKTLSLKLNKHTIHFFYNEHTNDFALYTEAIKFFNHSESMVRIAVRTITLNVYRACKFEPKLDENDQPIVDNNCMLRYIRDKTLAPYFSNLVWFIGNHVLELDACVRQDIDHNSRGRLSDLVAEHLDHLHYLNDILCLDIDALNEVLTDHLLNRLFIPLYVYSLIESTGPQDRMGGVNTPNVSPAHTEKNPRISSVVSLFLLSQVFLIIHYSPLVRQLSDIIINGEPEIAIEQISPEAAAQRLKVREFVKPTEDLSKTFATRRRSRKKSSASAGAASNGTEGEECSEGSSVVDEDATAAGETSDLDDSEGTEAVESMDVFDTSNVIIPIISGETLPELIQSNPNCTDEEKLLQTNVAAAVAAAAALTSGQTSTEDFDLDKRPYMKAVFAVLDCTNDDYKALFSLCLLYALGQNTGLNQDLLDSVQLPTDRSKTKHHYNSGLVKQLIEIMSNACQNGGKVRLATLELTILVLESLVYAENHCFLQDCHLAAVEGVREEATLLLRSFYKSEEIFLDMFEDEYRELSSRPLNIEYLTMDASILLPPTGTPLTGIDFSRRLPCGEVERARRAIRVLFMVRKLSYKLRQEPETQLPLTTEDECVKVDNVLDLNNSDLIACTIINKENKKERRFLVIDIIQLILVEPDAKRLGWGVVRFVGFLQDVEVTGDKDDSRCLHITIHKPTMNHLVHGGRPNPLLTARFVFDDHIRCMAARQRLTKGRLKARQRKMQMIAKLLELPANIVDSMYQQSGSMQSIATGLRSSRGMSAGTGGSGGQRSQRGPKLPGGAIPGRSHVVAQLPATNPTSDTATVQRSVFASVDQVPGFNAAKEQEPEPISVGSRMKLLKSRGASSSVAAGGGSAEAGPEVLNAGQKQKLLTQAMQVAQRSRMRAAAAEAELKKERVDSTGVAEEMMESTFTGNRQTTTGVTNKSEELLNDTLSSPRRKISDGSMSNIPVYRRTSPSVLTRTSSVGRSSPSGSPSPDRTKPRPYSSPLHQGHSLDTATSVSASHQIELVELSGGSSPVKDRSVNSSEDMNKLRKSSGPKSLQIVDGMPMSLIIDNDSLPSRHDVMLDSPVKLVPPVKHDVIHRFIKSTDLAVQDFDRLQIDAESGTVDDQLNQSNQPKRVDVGVANSTDDLKEDGCLENDEQSV